MTNEDIARRYAWAVATGDADTADALRDPAWTAVWPQSGERVPDPEAMRRIVAARPVAAPAADPVPDRSPGPPVRLTGDGGAWVAEWPERRDGAPGMTVLVLEVEDGRVRRETAYWAPALEAPAWRRPFVELDHGRRRPDDPLRDRAG